MKNHLKRLAVPRTWKIKRKGIVFITRPNTLGNPLPFALPLNVVFRDVLKYAKTTKEVKSILQEKEIFVDGRRKKDHQDAVGLFAVLSIPLLKEHFRLVFDALGRLTLIAIDEKEATHKVRKLIGKTVVKGNKIQLHFNDGTNVLVSQGEQAEHHVGDSALFDLKTSKMSKRLPFQKGVSVYLIGGKHMGALGTVETVSGESFLFKAADGHTFSTPRQYAFVVGAEKPLITLGFQKHTKQDDK